MHFLRIALAMFGLCGPLACLAETPVYAFVDEQGELHLSNVPDDGRYQSLYTAPTRPAPAPTTAAPAGPALAASAPAGGEARAKLAHNGAADADSRRPYALLVAQIADKCGVEASLLHAVISVESGYNAKALSKRGAAGLMQLMPGTAKRYGVTDVFDPADNLRAGAQYLSDLLKMFGNDVRLALAAYNAGEAAVIKYGRRIPPYRETAAYVPKVVDFYQKFRLSM